MSDVPARWTLVVPPGHAATPTRVLMGDVPIHGVTAVHVHYDLGGMKRMTLEIICPDGLTVREPDPTKE